MPQTHPWAPTKDPDPYPDPHLDPQSQFRTSSTTSSLDSRTESRHGHVRVRPRAQPRTPTWNPDPIPGSGPPPRTQIHSQHLKPTWILTTSLFPDPHPRPGSPLRPQTPPEFQTPTQDPDLPVRARTNPGTWNSTILTLPRWQGPDCDPDAPRDPDPCWIPTCDWTLIPSQDPDSHPAPTPVLHPKPGVRPLTRAVNPVQNKDPPQYLNSSPLHAAAPRAFQPFPAPPSTPRAEL